VLFDADSQEWSVAKEKADKIVRLVQVFCFTTCVALKQTQRVMGHVNELAQMCTLLKFLKYSGTTLWDPWQEISSL
jgi:hypothetical protein